MKTTNHKDRMSILNELCNLLTAENLAKDYAGTMKKAEELKKQLNG